VQSARGLSTLLTANGDRLPTHASERSIGSVLGASPGEIQASDGGQHERLGTIPFQHRHRLRCVLPPLVHPPSQTRLRLGGGTHLRGGRFSWPASLLAHVLTCVQDAALLWHRGSVHQGSRFSHPPTAIAHDHLQALFWAASAFPEPLHQRLPRSMIFTVCHLLLEGLPRAIRPQSESHQDPRLFPTALLALSLV